MDLKARAIGDDEYVSQYGSRVTGSVVFRDRPRPGRDRGAVSVLLGKVTPAEARGRVRRSGVPSSDDGARYALAGDLRARSFIVIHTPWPGNTLHVAIRYPGEWDDAVAGKFNECFGEPAWHEEQERG